MPVTPPATTADLNAALQGLSAGDALEVQLRSPAGQLEKFLLELQSFPFNDQLSFFYVPYLIGLIYLGTGLWIFGLRRGEVPGRAFALLAASLAILSATLFDLFTTHFFPYLWTFALGLAGGALLELGLIFPQEGSLVRRLPILRSFGYLAGLGLSVYAATTLYDTARPLAYVGAWSGLCIFVGLAFLFFMAVLVVRWIRSRSPVSRSQARTILVAILLAFAPLAIWFLLFNISKYFQLSPVTYTPYLLLPLVLFPIMTGYTILRHRLLRTDLLIRQGALYAALSVLALAGYGLLVSGLILVFGPAFQVYNPVFIGA